MFLVQSDAVGSEESPVVDFGIKPMNCPGHCILFKETKLHSYRDLPVRYADFSTLHRYVRWDVVVRQISSCILIRTTYGRNEATGALTGLTRVRQFHQDDGHIFCTLEQVPTEIANCLSFIEKVYKIFGFEFQVSFSGECVYHDSRYSSYIPTIVLASTVHSTRSVHGKRRHMG